MMKKITTHFSDNIVLYGILLIGLIFRLVYLWEYSQLADWDQLTVDNNFHHNWAISILDGNIFGDTTYFRAPFYIFYLAGIYKLFGVSLLAVRLFSVIPGLLAIAITYLTGKEVYNKQAGLVAGLLHAIFPIIYYFESELLLDSFFTLLLQIGIYFFLRWWKGATVSSVFYSGLFLGLASITRPTALVIGLFIVVLILYLKRKEFKPVLLFSFGMILCIAPIFARNVIVADDPVLIASQGGINLYVGNNDAADGISAVLPAPLGFNWHIKQISYIAETESGNKLSQSEISSFWTSKAIDWILANPSRFIQLYFEKLYHSFSNREISNNRYLLTFFEKVKLLKYNMLSFGILFSLAILSILITGRQNKQAIFLVSVIFLYILVTSLFFFSSRFRLPLIPFYIILSGYSLVAIQTLLRKRPRYAYKLIGIAVVVGMFSYYPVVSLPSGSASHVFSSKGLYYSAHGDQETALSYFKRANELDKDYAENNLNIGATFLEMGNIDSAQYYINKEKELHPLQSKGFTNSASIFYSLEMYDSAYIAIQKSLKLEPYDIVANQIYVRILFNLELSFFDIQQKILEIQKQTDNNIYLLNDIALHIYNNPTLNNSLAISILHDAVKSTPPPIETDDASFAYSSSNSLLEWNKHKAKSYYHLGYIHGISGEFEKAVTASVKSIELDSTFVEAYVNLVSGYLSLHQMGDGKRILQIALKKFPQHKNLLKIQELLK